MRWSGQLKNRRKIARMRVDLGVAAVVLALIGAILTVIACFWAIFLLN